MVGAEWEGLASLVRAVAMAELSVGLGEVSLVEHEALQAMESHVAWGLVRIALRAASAVEAALAAAYHMLAPAKEITSKRRHSNMWVSAAITMWCGDGETSPVSLQVVAS